MRLISSFLSRAADLYSDRLAVIDGDRRYTFLELQKRVHRLVGALRQLGLSRGDRVAVIEVNSSRYLELYYACVQAGFILTPLNIRLSSPEISYILRDCSPRVLVISKPFFNLAQDALTQGPSVDSIISIDGRFGDSCLEYEELIASAAPAGDIVPQDADDICNIYYTSGTTGEPKGVCLTLGNMTASAWDSILSLGISRNDVWLHAAPMFHLVDAWAVWSFPIMGATQATVHFEPEKFLRAAEATGATCTALPPTLISIIAAHPRLAEFDLSHLKFIMFGGAPTTLSLLAGASAVLPSNFVHAYGITETSGITTVLPPDLFRPEGTEDEKRLTMSAGHAVANLQVCVVDSHDVPSPSGEIGEVVVSGARVMRQYWGKPQQTAESIRNGWYHTGDMGFLDAQRRLFIVDRKKDMIITGGENVYSVEVENVLASHPSVMEVAVIGVPDPAWGEAVKGIVVLKRGAEVSGKELVEYCRGRIAGYKIPKSIEFQSESLPKIGPGKIAKQKLREPFWAGQDKRI